MTTGFIGADVAELRELANLFARSADDMRHIRERATHHVELTIWLGPSGVRFHAEWGSHHCLRVVEVEEVLRRAVQALRANADDQETASGASPGLFTSPWLQGFGNRDVPGWFPDGFDFNESMVNIEEFFETDLGFPGGWQIGDFVGLVPVVGAVPDIVSMYNSLRAGEVPWHDMADVVGSGLRHGGDPVSWALGFTISNVADGIEGMMQTDFSAEGWQGAWDELTRDPVGNANMIVHETARALVGNVGW